MVAQRLPRDERKSYLVGVRVTEPEAVVLERYANSLGYSMAEYFRQAEQAFRQKLPPLADLEAARAAHDPDNEQLPLDAA